jgi:hypothetical protein
MAAGSWAVGMPSLRRTTIALGLVTPLALIAAGSLITYRVTPQSTDPAIGRFNRPHYIVFDGASDGPPCRSLIQAPSLLFKQIRIDVLQRHV